MDSGILAQQSLKGQKLQVKLDKGFTDGTYCVYVEYDDLAADTGFRSAWQTAKAYAALLREQLGKWGGYALGEIDDPSRVARPGRKRDFECTFLSFPLDYADGRFHDAEMSEHFRLSVLRASQASEQGEARVQARRRHSRQGRFRERLAELLAGAGYEHMDAATKQRLAEQVTRLVFPERDIEL
jgi:hypothetical protein